MRKEILVLGELRVADLLVAEAARGRSLEVAVLSDSPQILEHLPHSQRQSARLIDRVIRVERWDSPDHVREVVARELPGRVPLWYTGLDEPSQSIAALRQAEGLPTPGAEVISNTLNKARLKCLLHRKGLSRLVALRGDEVMRVASGSVDWPFDGPGFLQLAFGAGSYGTRKVANADDVSEGMRALRSVHADSPSLERFMRGAEFVLTQAAKGTLHSLEAVVVRGRLYPLGFSQPQILEANLDGRESGPMLGTVHPVEPLEGAAIIAELERRIVADGYADGFLHVELMIDESGAWEEIDRNPRPIGAHCQWAMNAAWGMSMGDLILDWIMGEFAPEKLPATPSGGACLRNFLGPIGGGRLMDLRMPESPQVRWTVQFAPPGTLLPADPVAGGKIGGYLTVAATSAESEAVSRALRGQVSINGSPATF